MSNPNEIGCTVLIDGQPINDGCISTDENVPTVLSGLRVVWGRHTTVDQPVPSVCTFTVTDPLFGSRMVPSLTIGRKVDVRVDTVVYPPPSGGSSTITRFYPTGGFYLASTTVSGDGLTMTATADGSGRRAGFYLPPLPQSDDPFAWDGVPRSLPGQAWRYTLTITPPAPFAGWSGWRAEVAPGYWTNPNGVGGVVGDWTPCNPTADVTFIPPPGVWIGLAVHLYPTGPAWDQLDATAWNTLGATPTWDGLATFTLTGMAMIAPAAGTASSALVFSGRITDVVSSWNGSSEALMQVTAQDWLAELANRVVGDQPWAAEPLGARAQRVVQLSGQPVALSVDPGVSSLQVTYRDVDRQPATGLLQQLATTCGGVLWTATHMVTGQVMRIEDVTARPAVLTLAPPPTYVRVVPSTAAVGHSMPVSACNIDVDPVRLLLDMGDTISTVDVQWLEQTQDPGPPVVDRPTQRTVTVTDAAMTATIGSRRLSVSTQLTTQVAAETQANQWLARASVMAWRIEGLSWDSAGDLGPDDISTLMTLLDGTRRNGLPIALTDLPAWSGPMTGGGDAVALYVEGGDYTYDAGSWVVEILTSAATGSAIGSFPWNASLPAWKWTDYDPGMSWLDLFGVTYPDV